MRISDWTVWPALVAALTIPILSAVSAAGAQPILLCIGNDGCIGLTWDFGENHHSRLHHAPPVAAGHPAGCACDIHHPPPYVHVPPDSTTAPLDARPHVPPVADEWPIPGCTDFVIGIDPTIFPARMAGLDAAYFLPVNFDFDSAAAAKLAFAVPRVSPFADHPRSAPGSASIREKSSVWRI